MSSSKRNFQNTRKWDGKDDVCTQHDWNTNSWSWFVAPRALISEEKSKITNGANGRWKTRRKKERERRKKEGRGPLGGPVMLNGLGWLSRAMLDGVALTAWLRPHGEFCVTVESSHTSAHDATPLWIVPIGLVWLKRARFEKKFWPGSFLKFWLKYPK
jgi:hypothetical protein